MKAFSTLIVLLSLTLLFSCDGNISSGKGRTILISVASDYTDSDQNTPRLGNTPNDQAAIVGQISELAKGNIEVYVFRVDNGRRYAISPDSFSKEIFEYGKLADIEDRKNGLSLARTKRILVNEENVQYFPRWTFSDVLKTIERLNAGKDDLIIFHYSGHGASDGSLLSYSNDKTSDIVGTNNIINTLCAYNKEAVKVMLIDSCFSGTYIKDTILSSTNKLEIEGKKDIYKGSSIIEALIGSFEVALGKDTYGTPNLFVLSASTNRQESFDGINNGDENQQYYGAFSFYLLRALGFDTSGSKPAYTSKEITFANLYHEIWTSFPLSTKKEQTPLATPTPLDVVLF